MNLLNTTAPVKGFVTLAEAKAHCRVEINDDDPLIASLILRASRHFEGRFGALGRALITQVWEMRLNGFPSGRTKIELPFPPLQSVDTIAYTDADGNVQALAPASLVISTGGFVASMRPLYGETWPTARADTDTVTITFTAGYGAAESDVPEPLRQAALLLIGHWYENREAVLIGTISKEIEFAVKALSEPYKIPFWAAEE